MNSVAGNTSATPETGPTSCWHCKKDISPTDRFCRHCGKGQGRHVPWYYRHWGIIALTLLALGPFSLSLVWRSPVLTRRAQWMYTAAISLITYYVCVTAYHLWLQVTTLAGSILQFS